MKLDGTAQQPEGVRGRQWRVLRSSIPSKTACLFNENSVPLNRTSRFSSGKKGFVERGAAFCVIRIRGWTHRQ